MDELQVLYEDEAFLVINKPSGMTVNKAETTQHEFTVQDWMEKRYGIQMSDIKDGEANPAAAEGSGEVKWDPEVEFYKRGGVVHRLDKETSGILLLAKTPAAFAALQKQFKDRTVHKVYRALCHGSVIPKEGEISVPVGRLPWNRKQFGIVPGGRPSVTKYKVISEFRFQNSDKEREVLSLVELYPETGRTHQIRVHMKYIGFPLFGDFLYAGRKTSRDDRKLLERVFLHAAKISFRHPSTDEAMHFEAPLPTELQGVLDKMEKV